MKTGKEVMSSEVWQVFEKNYLDVSGKFELKNYSLASSEDESGNASDKIQISLNADNQLIDIEGEGGGPIEAFISAVNKEFNVSISVSDYHQHSVTSGSDAKAAAFIELVSEGKNEWGAGIDGNTVKASFQAIIAGLNKLVT